ncbi:MAG: hypothetical protein IMW91_10445 [Firmicutes bacterium]|nr:hypothetical protein [Bacillota bacterium]
MSDTQDCVTHTARYETLLLNREKWRKLRAICDAYAAEKDQTLCFLGQTQHWYYLD